MFIRLKKHVYTNKQTVLICHSKRVGTTVKQLIIKSFGSAENEDKIAQLKKVAIKELAVLKNSLDPRTISDDKVIQLNALREISRKHTGISDIFGKLFDQCGFDKILPAQDSAVLKAVILARITEPSSKLRASEILQKKFGLDISVDKIYRMLDKLYLNHKEVQKKVFDATLTKMDEKKIDVLFFDVTTLYFESVEEDELRDFGYSKDQKFNATQVVLALATNKEGMPVGYKLFPGNTAEITTLIACIKEWKRILPIEKVTFVGDRGMMSAKNIECLEEEGMDYVVACPLKKLSKEKKAEILNKDGYDSFQMGEGSSLVKELKYSEDKRLIVTFNTKRRDKDRHNRERIIERIKKRLGKEKSAKKLISNSSYKKYTAMADGIKAELNDEKIEADSQWDGLHGVITNTKMSASEIISRYKQLWIIEESFRINKHTLKMRPIYHYTPKRIYSHISLCYLTFSLMRYAQHELKKANYVLTLNDLKEELIDVQVSLLANTKNGEIYRLPSASTPVVQDIYKIFNIPLEMSVQEV